MKKISELPVKFYVRFRLTAWQRMRFVLSCVVIQGILLVLISGCSFAPKYTQPKAPVPVTWPESTSYNSHGASYGKSNNASYGKDNNTAPHAVKSPAKFSVSSLSRKEFFIDENLGKIIEISLKNNRDLRLAALNAEEARALYGIQRSELFPTMDAVGMVNKRRLPSDLSYTGKPMIEKQYSVDFGISSWEIDFFGRIRSLKEQALQNFLATDQARRSAQIALVAEVAQAYYTFAADRENLKLSISTFKTQQGAYNLIESQYKSGLANELDLRRAQTQVDSARGTTARYTSQVARDKNALNLLAGFQLPKELLPKDLSDVKVPESISCGLSSNVLLNRPDIMSAEHQLKAAYAFIGAARASFFPRIALTTGVGTASSELSGLFKSGSGTWNFAPQAALPVFDARIWAAYRVSKAQRKIALAKYEKTIQTAFREVADALAVRGTIDQQVSAQQSLVKALEESYRLARTRYTNGIDSYLSVLDAQRSLFDAQQGLNLLRLTRLVNDARLYAVLGGGEK